MDTVNKELQHNLTKYREAHNPKIKQQFKTKTANALKKRKMYEQQLTSLEGSSFTLEGMTIQADMMKDQMTVVKSMQQSNVAAKDMMKEMNCDTMFDMALDMQEMKDDMNEMNEMFMESYQVDVDDGELDAELDELDFESQDTNFNVNNMTQPNQKLISKKEQDEKQLEKDLM